MENKVLDVISGNQETIYLIDLCEELYSLGRSFRDNNELLYASNIPIIYTNRGGKAIYHGPGQRIIYPVLNLSLRSIDIRSYVFLLESWIINTLCYFGIKAYSILGKIGTWVKINGYDYKIAAIGLRLKKNIVYHGIVVNINPNLKKSNSITICGLQGSKMTSIKDLGINVSKKKFDNILKNQFNSIFK